MNRMITGVFTLFIGFFTLIVGLILAIPLTIAALITGKKIEKAIKMNNPVFNQASQKSAIEGEYEEVTK
ncbi:hypothetical protein L1D54_17745 [Vibrio brasiliensis]|uniref:Hydroxylamine reductase n=1 Tax=Vibrio brasiliensis LMG 20546 TaxID=945543 RepID=E8LVD6_9VIBR|nr:hypothetical protein [Vibrio brasiliensis]EGA65521.1 hypothetical protein VIBR0546_14585 [Vibrio brasiliensis LMG 20546]MCG9649145.1 hypothetical protein [Vibrio brasiliensis]MCG9725341.1 hypothetical protein [Vibrio brasiliensis]MCG9752319.1 hypothetical protein [Vibrio brasiliensis]